MRPRLSGLVIAAIASLLVAGCQAGLVAPDPAATVDPNVPRPFPDGCGDVQLSLRRCDFIVWQAEKDLNVQAAEVQRVELLGDPGCGADPTSAAAAGANPAGRILCVRTASVVVRVRVTTTSGTQEESILCGIPGSQYSLACSEHPEIGVYTSKDGYFDIPGDATPVPTINPVAESEARPLRLGTFVVPLDHLGPYDVLVGMAILPNGILTDAAVGSVRIDPDDVVLDGPIILKIVAEPGRRPFDNSYDRGWHEGTETVSVDVQFSISEPPATGTLTLFQVVVR
jgi:hypothetical protein